MQQTNKQGQHHSAQRTSQSLCLTTLDADFKASSVLSSSCPQPAAPSTSLRGFRGPPHTLLPPEPAEAFRMEDVLAASLRPLLPLPPPPPPPSRALLLEPGPLPPLPLLPWSCIRCTQAWDRFVHRSRSTRGRRDGSGVRMHLLIMSRLLTHDAPDSRSVHDVISTPTDARITPGH